MNPRPVAARAAPSGINGLTAAEAAARLQQDGPNVLPAPRRPNPVRELGAQMVHFFVLMLWIAGGLAFVAGLPELVIAIFVVVVVNGVFAFAQEARAERAAARLRDLLPRRAQMGWASNRFLLGAVAVELVMLIGFLWIPAIADLLRQAVPSVTGGVVALCAVPAVLVVDAIAKAILCRRHPVGPV